MCRKAFSSVGDCAVEGCALLNFGVGSRGHFVCSVADGRLMGLLMEHSLTHKDVEQECRIQVDR